MKTNSQVKQQQHPNIINMLNSSEPVKLFALTTNCFCIVLLLLCGAIHELDCASHLSDFQRNRKYPFSVCHGLHTRFLSACKGICRDVTVFVLVYRTDNLLCVCAHFHFSPFARCAGRQPVPLRVIWAVKGKDVDLPCDITTSEADDNPKLILWFKDTSGIPFYR